MLCFSCTAQYSFQHVIPIEAQRWYQLNTVADTSVRGLFDGQINKRVMGTYGQVLSNYETWYPVLDGEKITIDSIMMYDGEGSFADNPLSIYVITQSWQRVKVATFNGSQYNQWVGPSPNNPSVYALSTPADNIRYIVISSANYNYPDEIVFCGNYSNTGTTSSKTQPPAPLSQMFGVNGFEWDFEDPTNPSVIDETRMKPIHAFTGIRHYLDWNKIEPTQGNYTYNPTYNGSWNYDAIYDRCKKDGIEVLACIKTLPPWMLSSYPDSLKDVENVPTKYGMDFKDPKSYLELAKVGFQFAARYGYNTNVDPSLVSVYSVPRWTADPVNVVKIGMGLVKYIECENERDKWWKGRKAYQTGREYAASLSAFYDGNKNTMGAGVGVKNADPTMKVVMAGLADASTDYVRGMIDWCKEFRGYNADGSVNICWDIINYHYYANDGQQSQSGTYTRGAAPEVTTEAQIAKNFVQMAQRYLNGMPVWMSETGYDLNQNSQLRAIPIGNKNAIQTQADWILRTSLLYARTGINRVFFFELYDNQPDNPTNFNSMGLINADKTRRPAADYLFQAKRLMGDYVYKETINADPIVDRYELNGQSIYMLVVPDEKGRTATYNLNLGTSTARIFTPTIGSDSMSQKSINTVNGIAAITATETPVFVIAGNNSSALNVPANAGSITGPTSVCQKASVQYSVAPVDGATSYQWTLPPDWTLVSGAGSSIITVVAASSGGVSVQPVNQAGMGNGSSISVTTLTVPVLNPISGSFQVCEKSLATYNTSSINAANYTWALTGSGWNLNSLNGTSTIQVMVGSGSGSLSVIGTNQCGSSAAVVVAVTSLPLVASVGLINGNDAICQGVTQSYNISAVANASSYSWSVPAGWSISSGQGSTAIQLIAAVGSGNVSVVATNSCGNTSTYKNVVANSSIVTITSAAGTAATRNLAAGCTYAVASNEFDATATSSCGSLPTLNWQLAGATTGTGAGSLAGVNFNRGVTTISWTANNTNSSTYQTAVTVNDITPPTIKCSSNISRSLTGNRCSVSISITNPAISDNCSVTVLAWVMTGSTSARSSSTGINYVGAQTFNVGVTYIAYTAIDAAGNQSNCQFSVTVTNPRCSQSTALRTNAITTSSVLSLKAYPNPSDNYFNILVEGGSDKQIVIRVIDMMGRLIELKQYVSPGTVIQFGQNYKPGFYLFEAIQGEEKKQLKVVKGPQLL